MVDVTELVERLPPWTLDAIYLEDRAIHERSHATRPVAMTTNGHAVLKLQGTRLATIQAISGSHGKTSAFAYQKAASQKPSYKSKNAGEVANRSWIAVTGLNTEKCELYNHNNCVKKCPARNIKGFDRAKLLVQSLDRSYESNNTTNEAEVHRWMSSNADMKIGKHSLQSLMEDIRLFARPRRAHVNFDERRDGLLQDCTAGIDTSCKHFANGLRVLRQFDMRLALTNGGDFAVVYCEANVDNHIYHLDMVPLPVVLREKPSQRHDHFNYIGEVEDKLRSDATPIWSPFDWDIDAERAVMIELH